MKINKSFKLYFVLLLLFVLAACSSDQAGNNDSGESAASEKGSKENFDYQQALWMMKPAEDHSSEQDLGTLYVKYGNEEPSKISDNVMGGSHLPFYDNAKALYLDSENNLYLFEKGQENVKIGTGVGYQGYRFSSDGSNIYYLNHDYDLYVKEADKEKSKLASNVLDYEILEDEQVIYYIDYENNLYKSDFAGDKTKLVSDAFTLHLTSDNTVYFQNDEGNLYQYDEKAEDKIKITENAIEDLTLSPDGKFMTYLTEYNYDKSYGELYIKMGDKEPVRIASDVTFHDTSVDSDYIYYITYDNGKLYQYKPSNEKKENIASGVQQFIYTSNNKTVAYLSDEDDPELFLTKVGKEADKISSDITEYDLFDDESLIFQNEEGNVFYKAKGSENEKLVSDLNGTYYLADGQIYYLTNDNKIGYVSLDSKEKVTLLDDLSGYESVYVDRYPLYRQDVASEEVVEGDGGFWGYWYSAADDVYFSIEEDLEFTDSGIITFSDSIGQESSEFTITGEEGNEVEITFDDYGTYGWITMDSSDSITLTLDASDSTYYLTRVSADEYDDMSSY